MTALDIGAGDLSFTRSLLRKGVKVTAIDVKKPKRIPRALDFTQIDLIDFHPSGMYNRIYALDVFQFCEKSVILQHVMPHLFLHLRPGGIIFVSTFSADPEPPLPIPVPSHYALEDFLQCGPAMYAARGTERVRGKDGNERLFHFIDYVAKKFDGSRSCKIYYI